MTQDSKANFSSPVVKQPGLVDQWGGKGAFFFTYTHLSHDITTGLLAALLPFIRQNLGLTYLQSGFLVSAYALTAGLSQILGGWASDRIGQRKAISLGLAGVGLSAIAISLAPSYFVLLPILIAMGVCAGFYHPSAISAVTTYFGADKRGRVVALHTIGGSLGIGLGPLIGALVARTYDWHIAYAILGIPALVASVLVYTRIKIPEIKQLSKGVTSSQTSGQKRIGVWQVFRPALGIIAVSVAMQLVTGPVMSFVALFMVDVHGLSATVGSMWVTFIRLGGMVGSLFGGWLSDRWGRRNSIFLNLTLFGPIVLLLAWLPFGVPLGAALIIFGALNSMRETNMQTYLMDRTPSELRATVIGIYFGFGQEGSSIIQPVAGNVMDVIGIRRTYGLLSWIAAGFSSIAALFAFKSYRQNKPLRKS